MRNYLQPGDKLEVTAPVGGVTDGVGYVLGNGLFVVAEGDAIATAKFIGIRKGVVNLAKNTSDAVTEGNRCFWDDTAKEVRAASDTGLFMIGTIRKSAADVATTCEVVLDGISVAAVPAP